MGEHPAGGKGRAIGTISLSKLVCRPISLFATAHFVKDDLCRSRPEEWLGMIGPPGQPCLDGLFQVVHAAGGALRNQNRRVMVPCIHPVFLVLLTNELKPGNASDVRSGTFEETGLERIGEGSYGCYPPIEGELKKSPRKPWMKHVGKLRLYKGPPANWTGSSKKSSLSCES